MVNWVLTLEACGESAFWRAESERSAALFDSSLVHHHPADWDAIQNDPDPPLGLWLCDRAKGAIVLCGARVGVDHLMDNLNKTRSLGPILQVLDNIPFLQRDCLPGELTPVVRVTGESTNRSENTPGHVGSGENLQMAGLGR